MDINIGEDNVQETLTPVHGGCVGLGFDMSPIDSERRSERKPARGVTPNAPRDFVDARRHLDVHRALELRAIRCCHAVAVVRRQTAPSTVAEARLHDGSAACGGNPVCFQLPHSANTNPKQRTRAPTDSIDIFRRSEPRHDVQQ